jgi:broad specificity phosphatase PhoE
VIARKFVHLAQLFDQEDIDMIYLQRHGESVTNSTRTFTCRRLDPGLTALGRSQIEKVVPCYSTNRVRRILSSPSKRAVESAEILSSRLGVEFRIDECLLEVDVGSLEGKSEQDRELLAQFYSVIRDWLVWNIDTRFIGGESFTEVKSRLSILESLAASDGTVVVGHSTLFAVILGTRGTAFAKVEELFLPRGGMAMCDGNFNNWRIETRVEQTAAKRTGSSAGALPPADEP